MHKNQWQDYRRLTRWQLPADVRSWLLDRGSLTDRLKQASGGDFRVQVLQQAWQVPTREEARLLQLKPREIALVRQVLLVCGGKPWVYARSIIPQQSLQGRLRFLRRLRDSALGQLLFRDPHLTRSHFEVAEFTRLPPLSGVTLSKPVYGRRSLFHLYSQPLLVAEIFLPDCGELP